MQVCSLAWWRARPRKWLSYIVLCIIGWTGFFFLRIVNWTKIEGKDKFVIARRGHNKRERRNVVIVSNHMTMFDSFIVGIIAYFPEILFWPSVAPLHFAAQENYFKYWLMRLVMSCLNAIPVKSSRRDVVVMHEAVKRLPYTNIHIFPGGRRSQQPLGSVAQHPVRAGVGYIVAHAADPKPLLVPVFLGGAEKLFGGKPGDHSVARWLPRISGVFRRPLVRFGDPIPYQDILDAVGNNKKAWTAIANRAAHAINQLDPSIERVSVPD